MGRSENANRAYLLRSYFRDKLSVEDCFDRLREKALANGTHYYFVINDKDGMIEIVKGSEEQKKEKALSLEEVSRLLDERALYIHMSKGGFITLRKIPEDADKVIPLDEEEM